MSGMGETVSHMFIIDRLSDTNKFIRNHKEELKLYARLRNAIVHNPFGSEINVIAEPHPKVVAKYAALRDGIVNPPPALRFAILPEKIYSTTMGANAREVMRVMADKAFTYVPVLEEDGGANRNIFRKHGIFVLGAQRNLRGGQHDRDQRICRVSAVQPACERIF